MINSSTDDQKPETRSIRFLPSKKEKPEAKTGKDDSKSGTKAKKSTDKKPGGKVDSA